MRKKSECKTYHEKSEEIWEFGSPWSESLGFKCNTLIMFGPNKVLFWFIDSYQIYAIPTKGLRKYYI
jgi:hypothetical protein